MFSFCREGTMTFAVLTIIYFLIATKWFSHGYCQKTTLEAIIPEPPPSEDIYQVHFPDNARTKRIPQQMDDTDRIMWPVTKNDIFFNGPKERFIGRNQQKSNSFLDILMKSLIPPELLRSSQNWETNNGFELSNIIADDGDKFVKIRRNEDLIPTWPSRGRRSENDLLNSNRTRREGDFELFWGNRGKKNDESDVFWGNRGKKNDDSDPFWGNRGRRSDKLLSLSNRQQRDDDSPFWGNRGKKNEEDPFWGNRGKKDIDDPFWGNRGKKDDAPFWGNRGKKNDETIWRNRGKMEDDPFWGNRGKKDDTPFWGNRGKKDGEPFWGNRGKREDGPFWGNRGKKDVEAFWGNRGKKDDEPFWGNRGKKDDDHFWGNRGKKDTEPFGGNRGTKEDEPFWGNRGKKDVDNDPFWGNRGKKNNEDDHFWGNRGKKDMGEKFWGNRGKKNIEDDPSLGKSDIEDPFWGNRGKKNIEDDHFWGNRGKRDIGDDPFWGNRGKRQWENVLSNHHITKNEDIDPFWGNRGKRRDNGVEIYKTARFYHAKPFDKQNLEGFSDSSRNFRVDSEPGISTNEIQNRYEDHMTHSSQKAKLFALISAIVKNRNRNYDLIMRNKIILDPTNKSADDEIFSNERIVTKDMPDNPEHEEIKDMSLNEEPKRPKQKRDLKSFFYSVFNKVPVFYNKQQKPDKNFQKATNNHLAVISTAKTIGVKKKTMENTEYPKAPSIDDHSFVTKSTNRSYKEEKVS